jgi:hypothetical protein
VAIKLIIVVVVRLVLEKINGYPSRNHGGKLLATRRKQSVIVADFVASLRPSYWYFILTAT